jgi:hypothetical protein
MKLVKQTALELILQEGVDISLPLVFWLLGFLVVPLFIGYVSLSDTGITKLNCQRLEPRLVNCSYQKSQFFGLVDTKPIQLQQVLDVQLDEETRRDDEGSYQVYRVRLITPKGELYFTDFMPNYMQQAEWELQLRYFLESEDPSVQIVYDTRWSFGQIFSMAALACLLGVSVYAIYGMVKSKTLILDKRTNRAIYHTWTLLGDRYQYVPLRQIQDIDIREEVADGETYYEPVFLPMALNKFSMFRTTNLAEARHLEGLVRKFLQLPTQA